MRLINEFVKFFKDPKNLVILLAGSLFFTFLFGGVYLSDYMTRIPLVIVDQDNSQSSRAIVSQFEESEKYSVEYHTQSLDEMEYLVSSKKVRMALLLPPDFERNIKKLKGSSAAIIVDESNVAIGNNELSTASEILSTVSAGITVKLLKAKGMDPATSMSLAKAFTFESRILYDPKLSYKNYVMPGLIVLVVQQLFISVFVPKLIEERESILYKSLVYASVGAFSYSICFLVIKNVFHVSIYGGFWQSCLIVYIFLLSLVGPCMVIASIFRDRLKATQFCMMLSVPTFLSAGYVWPAYLFPKPLLYIVRSIWPLIYAMPCARDVMMKGTPLSALRGDLTGLAIFGTVWFALGLAVIKMTFKDVHRPSKKNPEPVQS